MTTNLLELAFLKIEYFKPVLEKRFSKKDFDIDTNFLPDEGTICCQNPNPKKVPSSGTFPIFIPEDLKSSLGRKWKENLSSFVLPFCHFLKEDSRLDRTVRSHVFPLNNQRLLSLFGYGRRISRAIRIAVDTGLLLVADENYSFKNHQAKTYFINKEMVDDVISFCEKSGIPFDDPNNKDIPVLESELTDKFGQDFDSFKKKLEGKSSVDFKLNKTNLSVPTSYLEYAKKFYESQIKVTNPMLEHYQNLRKELNLNLPIELQGNYNLKFEIKHGQNASRITKVGIRDWNYACTLKAHRREILKQIGKNQWDFVEDETDQEPIIFDGFAKEILKCDSFVEYDVKSSVPRVLYLLKTGKWVDASIDLYEQLNGKPFSSRFARKLCKANTMRALFQTEKQYLNNVLCIFKKKEQAKNLLSSFKERIIKILGSKYSGSECFLHESNIYVDVEHELQKQGFRYIKKYDAFYFPENHKPSREDFDLLVEKCALDYYNKWFASSTSIKVEESTKVESIKIESTKVQTVIKKPVIPPGWKFDKFGTLCFDDEDDEVTDKWIKEHEKEIEELVRMPY